MPRPKDPKRKQHHDPNEDIIPGWVTERVLELKSRRWSATPWEREEIDKAVERLLKIRATRHKY